MATNTGITPVIAPIDTPDSLDTFPTGFANKLKGGYKTVSTLAERNAIPSERKQIGDLVKVEETGLIYHWNGTDFDTNIKNYIGLNNVDNTSDLNKPISNITQTALNAKVNISDYTNGITSLGNYNASTNTPTLTATPDSGLNNGAVYDVTTSGVVGFGGLNFASGITLNIGDQLKKQGTQWYLIQKSNIPDYVKGIISHTVSNSIDDNIASAVKNIYLEVKSAYVGNTLSIRILGYVSSQLMLQVYNVTTATSIYNITLSGDTSKPSGIKRYIVHLPNEYYLDLLVDWNAFTGAFLQSTAYSIVLANNTYNINRLGYGNYTNGIKSYTQNGTDERIAYAIKFLRFENATMNSNNWAISSMGYDGISAVYLRLRNTTTNTTYSYKLEDAVAKPSGIKRYFINNSYDTYIELTVDWSAFAESNIISSTYTASIITNDYDKNRASFNQYYNGVNSFSVNGNDEKIALAIKNIYFEFTDSSIEFAISQIGFNGTQLVLLLRNLSTSTTTTYLLSSDTSKPSGVKTYKLHNVNDSYLEVSINWDAFIAQAVSSSTYTTKIRVNSYNYNRANQLSSVDENEEIFRLNSPKYYSNLTLDFSKYPIETGSLSSTAQDSVNNNRLRTKYAIPVQGGSTINYTLNKNIVNTQFTMVIQQVLVTGVKQYTLISGGDSGTLTGDSITGIGSLTLNPRCEYIRIFFRKLVNGTETKLNLEELTSTNFSITTNFGIIDSVNNKVKFTDNQLMNRFIQELYVEGLDTTIPYTLYYVQKNTGGLHKIYIYNKNTNTSVFTFAPSAIEYNAKGIFDITIGSVRVRGIFDWTAIPNTYNVSNLGINLTDKIFDINYSPRISAYYSNKEIRGSKLFTTRDASAVDNNHIFNAIIPYKNVIPAFMNGMKAEEVKSSTQVTYDTISYAKNGSVGLLIGNYLYEFCNEKDTELYDVDSNVFVRKIDVTSKTLISKTKIIGYGDTVLGEAMARIPYTFAGIQINNSIRIYTRVVLATSGTKMGYIDFNTTDNTFTAFTELNFNINSSSVPFNYTNCYTYLKDTLGSTLLYQQHPSSKDLTIGKHVMSYGGFYYMLVGFAVGITPYNGAYHSLLKSSDGVTWSFVYTFNDRGGQDDGDMFIKDGILYAQLRQNFGSNFSTIVAYNLATNKEIASQQIKAGTCRGEFFEYNSNLYLLINTDDTRQHAVLYKIVYANEGFEMFPILSVEGWISNWSIHYHSGTGKIFVFFGVQIWEFKIDQYNTSVSTSFYNLLK